MCIYMTKKHRRIFELMKVAMDVVELKDKITDIDDRLTDLIQEMEPDEEILDDLWRKAIK
jgi:hypothetical protein